jgi:hypothetical protein
VSAGALAWTRGRAPAGLAAGPASRLPVRRRQRLFDLRFPSSRRARIIKLNRDVSSCAFLFHHDVVLRPIDN